MLDQCLPCGVEVHQVSANRVMFEHEAMQTVAVMHLAHRRQFDLQQFIELRRVRLAPGRFHDLADEEPEQLIFTAAVIRKLLGVGGDHGVDHALDRGGIGDLLEALRLDDGVRRLAFGPHGFEYILGDFARNRRIDDARQQSAQCRGRHPRRGDLHIVAIERARQFAHDPIGRKFGMRRAELAATASKYAPSSRLAQSTPAS